MAQQILLENSILNRILGKDGDRSYGVQTVEKELELLSENHMFRDAYILGPSITPGGVLSFNFPLVELKLHDVHALILTATFWDMHKVWYTGAWVLSIVEAKHVDPLASTTEKLTKRTSSFQNGELP